MCFDEMTYIQEGYVCFREKYTKIMNLLDETFKSFISEMNFEEYHIPSIINGNILRRCGYFDKFPQNLTVIGRAKEENYPDIVKEKGINNNHLYVEDKYLTPAACLHIYPMLEKQNIKEKVITTKERVYRYEGEKFTDLTRLWEFTVREVVFVGSSDFVWSGLEKIKEKALKYAKSINENAYIKSASDNFYPNRVNDIKAKMQKANSFKSELIIPVGEEKVAVSSFNFHGTYFSKTFDFDREEEIVTGCVGFGIERWVAAYCDSDCKFAKEKK